MSLNPIGRFCRDALKILFQDSIEIDKARIATWYEYIYRTSKARWLESAEVKAATRGSRLSETCSASQVVSRRHSSISHSDCKSNCIWKDLPGRFEAKGRGDHVSCQRDPLREVVDSAREVL